MNSPMCHVLIGHRVCTSYLANLFLVLFYKPPLRLWHKSCRSAYRLWSSLDWVSQLQYLVRSLLVIGSAPIRVSHFSVCINCVQYYTFSSVVLQGLPPCCSVCSSPVMSLQLFSWHCNFVEPVLSATRFQLSFVVGRSPFRSILQLL